MLGLGLALGSGLGSVQDQDLLLPLGLEFLWGHLSQCHQEGPGPQVAQGALEVLQLHLALGLPERGETWHDSEGYKRRGSSPREKLPQIGSP